MNNPSDKGDNCQPSNRDRQSKYSKPHLIIPESDWEWVDNQQGYVSTLWRECWKHDRYGSRWVELKSTLSKNRFLSARKILAEAGLFEFKSEKLSSDGRKTDKWFVRNLHGARVDSFWRNPNGLNINRDGLENNPIGVESNPNGLRILPETHTEQAFENLSGSYSGSNTVNKQEINKPTNTKNDQTTRSQDPVAGTDQQVGREQKPASNLTDAGTLDATPLEWKEVKERLIKKTEELELSREEFKRIRLWTDEGTLDARLYVVDLLPKEYETLRTKKHGSSEHEYEQYKILLLNELSDSIIASFEAREAMSTSLTA